MGQKVKPDIYVSVDIESDGPIPGLNSMLSIGAAAFYVGSRIPASTFEINIAPLEGATPDQKTLIMWAKQDPTVWSLVTKDPVDPADAMFKFVAWIQAQGTVAVIVPSTQAASWVHYYTQIFAPLDIPVLDLTTLCHYGIMQHPPPSRRGMVLDRAIAQGVLHQVLLQDMQGT